MPTYLPSATTHRIAAVSAGCAALLVFLMVVVTLNGGTGYQAFESLLTHNTLDRYNAMIVDAAPVLRRIYPLDTLYILTYVTMVFAMAQGASIRPLAWLAMIAALGTGLLDMIENNHILALAHAAEREYPAGLAQIQVQTVITQTKFNMGLLLTLMLSFLIPFQDRASRITRWLARGLVVAAPVALLTPATTLLYISMNIVLAALIAHVYWRNAGCMPLGVTAPA